MPVVETEVRPRGPYALAACARTPPCPTRSFRAGVLRLVFDTDAGPAVAVVAQAPDGALRVRADAADGPAALDALRPLLAVDRDPTPFHEAHRDDPRMGPLIRRLRGVRPLPLGSVAHALVRGVSAQLVTTRAARRVEFAAARVAARPHAGLRLALRPEEVRRLDAPRLCAAGLAARRADALLRAVRLLDLEGLRALPTPEVVRRVTAQPGLGPWTAGVVVLKGLGRWDHGMVDDLGLVRLFAAENGRMPAPGETEALLEPYAPWQGLASLLLLRGAAAARLPASPGEIARHTRGARPRRAASA
ncbi:MAG TPA: hypothetical protein VNT51_07800 [Miltoncostaeaceae bacterium]|nr:hypothetical protein [Miltoncostaeaceae bacterium]